MTRFLLVILVVLMLISMTSCNDSKSAEDSDNRLRLGLIVSLTGPAAEQGKSWMRGAELAAEQLNAKQKVVELYIEDDGTEPAEALKAFRYLQQRRSPHVLIGGTWDFLAKALIPEVNRSRISFITPTNPLELFTEEERESQFLFTSAFTVQASTSAMKCLLEKFDVARVFMLYPDLAWGTVHARSMRQVSENLGITDVTEFPFPMESYYDSVRSAAVRIKDNDPDLIYAPIDYAGMDILLKELQRLQVNVTVLGSQHIHSAVELSSSPEIYQHVYGIYPDIDDSTFRDSFFKRYGTEPRSYEYAGYDLVRFLHAIFEKQNVEIGQRLRSEDVSYRGLGGEYAVSEQSPMLVETPAKLVRVRSGKGHSKQAVLERTICKN